MYRDEIIELYTRGKWSQLSCYLEERVSYLAGIGAEVEFARALSYYGITSILLAEHHLLATVYKQIYDEYSRKPADIRVRAAYARFLALYNCVFGKTEQGAKYYLEVYNCYLELNWYFDEALMILESIYWFYFFSEEGHFLKSKVARLKSLDIKLNDFLAEEIKLLEAIINGIELPVKNFGLLKQYINSLGTLACFFKNTCNCLGQLISKGGDFSIEQETKLEIKLFGAFTVYLGAKKLKGDTWKNKQSKELLIYLLLHPYGQLAKEVVVEEFFPNGDFQKSVNRLYVAIHRLNRFVQDTFGAAKDSQLVLTHQGMVCLNKELLQEVDVHTFRKLNSISDKLWLHDQEAAIELMHQAVQIYSGELAVGHQYADWLEAYREELKNSQVKMLRRLASFYQGKKDYILTEEIYQKLLFIEPANEGLYEDYITYLLSVNRRADAAGCYQKLKKVLERELGISPSFALEQVR